MTQHTPCGCEVRYDNDGLIRLGMCPLHAAAPEMLSLLGSLVQAYEKDKRIDEYFRVAVSARALLAKIEGKESPTPKGWDKV